MPDDNNNSAVAGATPARPTATPTSYSSAIFADLGFTDDGDNYALETSNGDKKTIWKATFNKKDNTVKITYLNTDGTPATPITVSMDTKIDNDIFRQAMEKVKSSNGNANLIYNVPSGSISDFFNANSKPALHILDILDNLDGFSPLPVHNIFNLDIKNTYTANGEDLEYSGDNLKSGYPKIRAVGGDTVIITGTLPTINRGDIGKYEGTFIDNRPAQPTKEPTQTPGITPQPPASATPTNTPVPPTASATATPINTPVPPTASATATPTNTPTPTASATATDTPTPTASATPTNTPVPNNQFITFLSAVFYKLNLKLDNNNNVTTPVATPAVPGSGRAGREKE